MFLRADCTTLTSPVTGATWCLDSTSGTLKVWNGTAYDSAGLGGSIAMPNGTTYRVNNYLNPTMSGSLNQYGIGIKITGTTVGGLTRAGLGVQAQSGGGGGAADQMEAINSVCQQNSADIAVPIVCNELVMNNNKTDDAADLTGFLHIGYSAVSDGNKKSAYGFGVSAAAGAEWRRGFRIDQGAIASGGYAFEYMGDGTNGAFRITATGALAPGSCTFANLATCLPTDGQLIYCSNCTIASPCNSGGSGAIAKRLNGTMVCN